MEGARSHSTTESAKDEDEAKDEARALIDATTESAKDEDEAKDEARTPEETNQQQDPNTSTDPTIDDESS